MNKTYYVCKYTPIELLESLGGECENFNHMPEGFDLADQVSHPNICGFGKTLLEGVMEGKIKELVLLRFCQCVTFRFLPVVALLDFSHYAVGWVRSDESIPYSHIKNRMEDSMNCLHTVWLKPNVFNEVDIEPLDITVLDVGNVLRAYLVTNIFPVHILVVGSC